MKCVPLSFHGQFFNLVMTVGQNLISLSLMAYSYPASYLSRICTEFPSIKIDLTTCCGSSKSLLMSMGSCARAITMISDGTENHDVFEQIGERCHSLERIQVMGHFVPSHNVTSLFVFQQPLLREFHMVYVSGPGSRSIIESLAKNAPALEVFHLFEGICCGESFRLLSEYFSRLMTVCIENVPYCGLCKCNSTTSTVSLRPERNFGDVITIISRSVSIRNLQFSCDRSFANPQSIPIEELQGPYALARQKKISVDICGYPCT